MNDVSGFEGDGGALTFTFTFRVALSAPAPAGGVSFDIATQDNTATATDGDYVPQNLKSQTIPAGDLAYSFEVTVNGDLKVESNETFFVNVTKISGATSEDSQGLGTIQNDDNPTLTINDVSANETNSGTTTFTFTVTSSLAAPAGGITFDIATADDTAQDDNPPTEFNDYVAKKLTAQTITAGNTTYAFQVRVSGDTLVEPNETFFVGLANVLGATIDDGQGQGTIQNDDTANLVISQVYAGGGNSAAQFTNDFIEIFNRGTTTINFSATPYSIQYAGATANFGSNKTNLTSGTISPGKYFLVQLSSGGAIGTALPAADASGSINMAATAGKVSLVVGTASLPVSTCPGDDGGAPFNPNNPNAADFVSYGGPAICYEGPIGPAPAPSATAAEFRKAGGCTDTNDNAADFFVHAPGPRNTSSPLNTCTPGAPPNLSINDVTVAEGNNGSTILTFTVSLSAPARSTDITFDIATQNNTAATANNDYVARSLLGQIIPAGQQTYTFDVTVNADTAIEPDETFLVRVTNVSGATVTDDLGLGTIQNDDLPILSINDVSLSEGDIGTRLFTFTVGLSAPAPAAVTFDIAIQDNTASFANNDYVARSLTGQTIAAGSQNYNFEVTVNSDFNIESEETFFVNVTKVSGATVVDGQGLGTIQNDDTPALSINDVAVNEGDSGTTTASFTITSSLPAPAVGITFNIATQDGTATSASGDYVAKGLTTQTIPAGQTTYSFSVAVNGDTLVEPNETFLVKITSVSGATLADDTGQGTIQNDDAPLVVISQLYGGGGNSGAVFKNDFIEVFNRGNTTVNLAGWSVQYSSATGSSWSLTPLCSTSTCLLLPGRYFLVQEDQGSGGTTNLPSSDASGTIVMTAGAGKVAVVSSTTALTGTCPSSGNIRDLVGYGGTASCFEGSAAAPAPGNTLADVRKGGGCVDTNNNAADFFTHAASPRNSAYPINNCSGQTTDLTINDVTATEGDAGTVTAAFTVTLHGSTGSIVTVDYTTSNGTAAAPADYQAIPTTQLVFAPGEVTKTIAVNVNGDTLDEPGETFFVNLSNASNAAILANQGQGTITDNDVPPTLTINDVSQNEGSGPTTFTFTVHLSAPALTGGVTFDISTADGTAQDDVPASEDNDYVGQALTGLNIPAGNQDYIFSLTVNGDMVNEPNETFFVNVKNVSGATVGDGQGLGTIQNDDIPALSINDVTVTEGDSGTTTAGFTVTLLPSSSQVVTVNYATANNTAIAPGDYKTTSGILTFNPGETSKLINVLVNGDTAREAICETFFVNLSIPTGGATITDPQGQGAITDNDGTKLVISQIYGGGGNASATFTNDFIEIFNRGNTAVSLNGISVQYSAATSTTGNYLVTPLPNVMLPPGRYFLVQEASGGAIGGALSPDATGTIVMAASAGKVALVNGTSALAAAGCPSGASIIDFVGYGTTANCREGASTANNSPGPSNNTTSARRKLAGCQDVGNNQQDFVTAAVSPRNTGTAPSLCTCDTSYSSMFMIPGLDSWMDMLAFLNEDAYPPPHKVSLREEISLAPRL
ncbi:MAG: Calx-beta domain-containing protein [Pyrinomonadaceae bacterium]